MEEKAKPYQIIILCFLCLIWLVPIILVFLGSFKVGDELFDPSKILPKSFNLKNYIDAFQQGSFGLYFLNSTYVSIFATILTVFINTAAGYALAKFHFRGRDSVLMSFLGTLMIPLEVIMIPMFLVIISLHLADTHWGLIIPAAATPTGVFIMRQYLLSLPDELLEAARIDGASEWKIFFNIVIPLSLPAMAILSIFSFMWRWNDWLWPRIVLQTDEKKYTIQVGLSRFIGEYNIDWGGLLAMSVLTMIPVLIIFLAFQRYFVKSLMTSGMKG